MDEAKAVRQIPIEDIIPNRFQPRINFDEKSLSELSNSIKQHGIIQPLVVRPLGDKFEIIAGERRYKAATMAGLSTVPAIVTEMDDGTSAEVALIENVQRKNLTSIEEAKSYKNMLERGNMTQEELAKKMGLSQSTIANKLRLLNLSDEVQDALMHEKISERHARALLSISNKEEQKKWLDRIINERLTVRQLDLAIKDEMNEKQQIINDGDIPIVDINPDIDSIINNAVDINPVSDKKEVDVFSGILDDNKPTEDNKENTESVDTTSDIPGDNESSKKNTMPNKFFNFLEDQEVNMNMTEEPKKEEIATSTAPTTFNFTPEFQDIPENNIVDDNIDSLDTLDGVETQSQEVIAPKVESNEPIDSLDTLEPDNLMQNNESIYQVEETNNQESTDSINNDNSLVSEPIDTVQENVNQNNEILEPVTEDVKNPETIDGFAQNNVINNNEFIFDDEEELEELNNSSPVENTTTSEPVNDDVVIEPIPIMQGEGIVDPVAYYDTLDPGFVEKIRQTAGLDLKTAINTFRDITSLLNEKGFKISMDEADMNQTYRIQIDINKE